MKKISKSEVKKAVVSALVPVMLNLELKKPSKRIRRTITKITRQLVDDWKAQVRKSSKALKKSRRKKDKAGKKEKAGT